MRVLADTNVLLAALGFGGICRAVVDVVIDSHELILSEHILEELGRNLREKLNHSAAQAGERVELLRGAARLVEPTPVPDDACRDPDDLPVLGAALAAEADVLVTGDKDLLALGTFGRCAILSPRAFWQRLR